MADSSKGRPELRADPGGDEGGEIEDDLGSLVPSEPPRPGEPGRARRGAPEVRLAIALEDAGELLEAARIFDRAGEHGHAATLRMELARTLSDADERLRILREGCARGPIDVPETRALHLALAEAVLGRADTLPEGAERRGLEIEAASALDAAGLGAAAGEIFEAVGLLRRAARAYERGGAVARLETVLAVLDDEERARADLAALMRDVEAAVDEGRRRRALSLLHASGGTTDVERETTFARLRAGLERRLPRIDAPTVAWAPGRATVVHLGPTLRLGRAPVSGIHLPDPTISREHVELSLRRVEPTGAELVAVDLGSRTGSFLDGQALVPGEAAPVTGPTELGLGAAAVVGLAPVHAAGGTVLGALVLGPASAHALFLPGGGRLRLARELEAPVTVRVEPPFVVLQVDSGVRAWLADRPLGPGATLELLIGDRVRIERAGAEPLVLEVIA